MSFQRGADVKACLGIGEMESLRIKLDLLRKHSAVSGLHTSRGALDSDGKMSRTLSLRVDFTKTDEEYSHIDQFLMKYLDPRFFTGAKIEDNSHITGISDYLGDLRQKPTLFTISLFIHPKYLETFPEDYISW